MDNGSVDRSEEKDRLYRFVLVYKTFGRQEDIEKIGESLLNILSVRLHASSLDLQIEPWLDAGEGI